MKFSYYISLILLTCFNLNAQENLVEMNINNSTLSQVSNSLYWIGQFNNGIAQISKNGYFGLVDSTGSILCEPKFDEIFDFEGEIARVVLNGEMGIINRDGLIVLKPSMKSLRFFENGISVYEDGNSKKGLIDLNGVRVTEAIYDYISDFHEGKASFKKDEAFGFITAEGAEFTVSTEGLGETILLKHGTWYIGNKLEKSTMFQFNESLAISSVKERDSFKYGFINEENQFVVEPKYDWVSPFFKEYAPVKWGDKWGVIDKSGDAIIPAIYDFISSADSFFIVSLNDKWGVIDRNQKSIISIKYGKIEYLGEDLYAALDLEAKLHPKSLHAKSNIDSQKNGAWGAVDSKGTIIVPFEYEKISWNGVVGSVSFLFESLPEPTSIPISTDLYLYMLFDVNGINSEHFYSYQIFNVGFTEVPDIEVNNVNYTFDWQPMKILDSGYVYLNQNGEIAINNVYGYAETFQNDLAVVGELISEGQDNRFKVLISKGMIDRNGEVIIPIVYQELVNHYNSYYLVKTNEKWGVINRENKFIVPQEFDQLKSATGGLITQKLVATNSGKSVYGFVDLLGKELIPPIYDKMYEINSSYLKVTLNNETFIIDKRGSKINR